MSVEAHERTVIVRAPAKVNLQLSIGPKGDDGYHTIATVFQAISLWETIVASLRDDAEITVDWDAQPTLHVPEGAIPLDETNLAVRAARAVAAKYGVTAGVDLRIVKGVPVAGGMAGGSADAAAALVACSEVWGVGATRSELEELAATLGADVPFVLHGHTAIGLGRGNLLTPAMTRGELVWVIATQSAGLSTPEVFAAFDRSVEEGNRIIPELKIDEDLMAALRAADPEGVADHLSNDLQDAALSLAPHLEAVLAAAMEAGALEAMISGSGPTVAALTRSRQHALSVAASVTASKTADAVFVATGPASGATIVAHGED